VQNVITRVQALIAKAESSDYPAEADAFMSKAQQLINDYAIDQARVRGADPSTVGHVTLAMQGSYSKERSLIWHAVANANRCQVLTLSGYGNSKVIDLTLIGRPDDRQLVQLLASSLELQALKRLQDLDLSVGHGSAVVQRRSFLRGFASEVADRLKRSGHTQAVVAESAKQALVLATEAVDNYVHQNFDVSRSRRSTVRHDGVAFSRGRRAGASADVGATGLGADRRALPDTTR